MVYTEMVKEFWLNLASLVHHQCTTAVYFKVVVVLEHNKEDIPPC